MADRRQHFVLTHAYIKQAFAHLEEVDDLSRRNIFFSKYIVKDVKWTVTGSGHDLAGTRYTLEDHANATFNRLGESSISPFGPRWEPI
jgi:hypothetical protein